MDKQKQTKKPLGIKLNNPGNIRFNIKNKWLGQISQQKGFVKFTSMEYGVRAIVKILFSYRTYFGHNFNISNIISRYAPPGDGDNDTNGYIGIVSHLCATPPDEYYIITDFDKLYNLVSAICKVETGYKLDYDDFKKYMHV